jgi:hypothetical protein
MEYWPMKHVVPLLLARGLLGGCTDKKKKDEPPSATERYQRRSKATEAPGNLRKIANGAKLYYETGERVSRTGQVLPRAFPAAGPTPERVPCGKKPVKTPESEWETKGWRALEFAIQTPHYYQYQVIVEGTGKQATFTARAQGDLDCDGKHSTFEITGRVDPDTQRVNLSPVKTTQETE